MLAETTPFFVARRNIRQFLTFMNANILFKKTTFMCNFSRRLDEPLNVDKLSGDQSGHTYDLRIQSCLKMKSDKNTVALQFFKCLNDYVDPLLYIGVCQHDLCRAGSGSDESTCFCAFIRL